MSVMARLPSEGQYVLGDAYRAMPVFTRGPFAAKRNIEQLCSLGLLVFVLFLFFLMSLGQ